MKNVMLSLKSIYMLLMSEDFPNYSESVIARGERKGLTMIRFWQELLAPEFRALPCGQMLWRNDTARNRYTSYLCNRSKEIRNYQAYARELSAQICENSLKNQISRFTVFLSGRKYRHDVLLQRISDLIHLARTNDPHVTDAIAGHIEHSVAWQPNAGPALVFQAAYLLSVMTLYAASGEAMGGPEMKLLQAEDYEIEKLWKNLSAPEDNKSGITCLTVHTGILQDKRLPKHRFFGRDEELFELRELAATGAKRLIVGMGGMGKTELMRQLIRVCEEDRIVDKIAVVPYGGDIIESFARSFPDFSRDDPEKSYRSILHQLTRAGEQGKVLLLIDNLTNSVETDPPLADLLSLPCGILITARTHGIAGMEAFVLQPPSIGTGALIFRDNYGRPIGPEDRACLNSMLADEALRLPLTLHLMASAARSKGWSVQTLKTQLEEKNALSWHENDQGVRLSLIFRQLYSRMQLPSGCRRLAELFTLLPRDSYTVGFLTEWFPECMGTDPEEKLAALTEGGWLERNETGFSMHPLIAQCLRRKVINQKHLCECMGGLVDRLYEMDWADTARYGVEQSLRVSTIMCYAMDFLRGAVDKTLMCAFLRASTFLMRNSREKDRFRERAKRMLKRCTETDDRVQVLYCTACGHFNTGDREHFLAVHGAQRRNPTVPEEMLLDFCLKAGCYFSYRKEYDLAQTFLDTVLAENAAPSQKAEAYYELFGCHEYRGYQEQSRQTALESAQFALEHPDIEQKLRARLMSLGCQMEIVFGNREAAEQWLGRIKACLGKQLPGKEFLDYETAAAAYELTYGSLEKAYSHYKTILDVLDLLWEKDETYYVAMGQMATVLLRLKRYTEAIETYLELLAYAKETGNSHLLSLFSNNLAVAYLELDQPQSALIYLDPVLENVRRQGGIALAEAQRNRARAFGQLGDGRREYDCLTEAVPLLEAAYGPEHPRTTAAGERLAALKREFGV